MSGIIWTSVRASISLAPVLYGQGLPPVSEDHSALLNPDGFSRSRKGRGLSIERLEMNPNEKMYAVKEAAGILGVSRDSVMRLIRAGRLKAIRFPRMGGRGKNFTWRIRFSDLSDFLSANLT
jgi:excisionase family DNA binding protein